MSDDELEARILARRAAFVAAAVAALGGAEACRTAVPATEPTQTVTLADPPVSDAAAPTASAKPIARDAGSPPPIDTGSNDIPPTACLSISRANH